MADHVDTTPAAAAGATEAKPTTSRYHAPGEGSSGVISVVSVVVLFAFWWLMTRDMVFLGIQLPLVKPLFVPKPEAVWFAFNQAMGGELDNHTLLVHFGVSFARVFSAFIAAILLGIPVGLGMGVSRWARGVFDPIIEFYRPLPPLAYLPLMIIWFGIDESSKIILLFLACFAPVALAARSGVRSASQEQIHAALSMGATSNQVLWHVILPSALPEILVGLRIGMGVAWTTLVAAEMVAATAGLGQMVFNASNFLRTDVVILGIILIGVVAYLFELLMRWLETILVPWKGKV
ncbi:MAG: ABC transporter permease subunit [Alphaproteobacteria bacterium]|nr:ABC transporter permease subunit [Alphaproteobacteria bacterium]